MLFSKRRIESELLDHLPAEEARPNLADLIRINQRFGGHSVLRSTVSRAADRSRCFSLLDVGCASGDGARLVRQCYPHASITCLDHNAVNMEKAPNPKVIADAFSLPFPPSSFDFVLASMLLHHFPDQQVTHLLREFYRIARKGLLICDLERRVIPYIFLPMTQLVFRWNYVTVHDGKRSVRASFRANELEALAADAGIPGAEVKVHRPAFRVSLIARK